MAANPVTSRRQFLRHSSGIALGFFGLKKLMEHPVLAAAAQPMAGYGPLMADPRGIFDLPAGFTYNVVARAGEALDDGLLLPGAADGSAAFAGPDGRVILIVNHELTPEMVALGPFGATNGLLDKAPAGSLYDPGHGKYPSLGGTSTHIYNPATGKTEHSFMSLLGTDRNCAGGPTPWDSWLTCEEVDANEVMHGKRGHMYERSHGYVFEVSAEATGPVPPTPIKAMGRFRHEAVAIDPGTGVVYLTEDLSDGLLYRFLPNKRTDLHAGGKLQALRVRELRDGDTRNWNSSRTRIAAGQRLPVTWIDLEDIDSPNDDLRLRGHDAGAAVFARGEGMWWGRDSAYFACTNGGRRGQGQVWRLIPSAGGDALELFAEPNDGNLLQNGDNLTVAPWGDLFLCEDHVNDTDRPQTLVGVTPQGQFYPFGRNVGSVSELAGCTFSPDGKTLFCSIQYPGLTLAITGPWERA